jgi:hypothetical protein
VALERLDPLIVTVSPALKVSGVKLVIVGPAINVNVAVVVAAL